MIVIGIVRLKNVLVAMIRAWDIIAMYVDRLHSTEAYLMV